jgi:hypothetical protein
MQKIETVVDEPHLVLTVGRSLGVSKSRQASLINAAEFAIEISGLDVQVRERCDGAWIFVRSKSSPVRVRSCTRP